MQPEVNISDGELSRLPQECPWDPTQADHVWPRSCKYFLSGIIDPQTVTDLFAYDSLFLEKLSESGSFVESLDLGSSNKGLQSLEGENSTKVLFLPFSRVFKSQQTTFGRYGVTKEHWLQTLDEYQIPPTAVELLHNKDGGTASFITHCSDNQKSSNAAVHSQEPCAYHVCLKVCTWINDDQFVYGRHDFHTGNNFVLICSLNNTSVRNKLTTQFEHVKHPHLFAIIMAILDAWADGIRTLTWRLDCATQRLESDTGFSNLNFQAVKPLHPEKLSIRKELAIIRESLHAAARASGQLGDMVDFLLSELKNYRHSTFEAVHDAYPKPLQRTERHLIQAFLQRKTQQNYQVAQLNSLTRRLDTQWEVVTALIGAHNTKLTIEMARDSRTDSILMRRIAFVTIIFLPATFMATFFSMSFFHVDKGVLSVSRWIWLYAVLTAPLTLFLGIAYGDVGEKVKRWHGRFEGRRKKVTEPEKEVVPVP